MDCETIELLGCIAEKGNMHALRFVTRYIDYPSSDVRRAALQNALRINFGLSEYQPCGLRQIIRAARPPILCMASLVSFDQFPRFSKLPGEAIAIIHAFLPRGTQLPSDAYHKLRSHIARQRLAAKNRELPKSVCCIVCGGTTPAVSFSKHQKKKRHRRCTKCLEDGGTEQLLSRECAGVADGNRGPHIPCAPYCEVEEDPDCERCCQLVRGHAGVHTCFICSPWVGLE